MLANLQGLLMQPISAGRSTQQLPGPAAAAESPCAARREIDNMATLREKAVYTSCRYRPYFSLQRGTSIYMLNTMPILTTTQMVLAVVSGCAVGFSLGLIGGGGSILAVPLLLYLVGYPNPHIVIGTTALAVSINAYINLLPHARAGNVQWKHGIIFAVAGAAAAFVGSSLGKAVDGKKLLFLFALLMLVVAGLMLRPRKTVAVHQTNGGRPSPAVLIKLIVAAVAVGLLSGFFGIGGGFLIVPGLALSTGMPMIVAIGTSLLSVGTFGLTTALNYARSGLLDWTVAGLYLAGGVGGGWFGARLATHLGARSKSALQRIFAALVSVVAVYMLYKNLSIFHLHG